MISGTWIKYPKDRFWYWFYIIDDTCGCIGNVMMFSGRGCSNGDWDYRRRVRREFYCCLFKLKLENCWDSISLFPGGQRWTTVQIWSDGPWKVGHNGWWTYESLWVLYNKVLALGWSNKISTGPIDRAAL